MKKRKMTIICQKIDVEKISNQIIEVFFEPFRLLRQFFRQSSGIYWVIQFFFNALATLAV
jgi:hypothetical protein